MKTQNGFFLPLLFLFLFDFRHSSAKIVINEYCAANKSVLVTSNEQKLKRGNVVTKDKYEDWIELYNDSDDDIILDGFFLSDDPYKLNKYSIPSGVIISARSHIIFICSGKNITTGGYYHTNFKLSQTKGNDVIVLSFDGNIIDSVRVLPCRANHSRGRMTDGAAQWGILDQPTPSHPNVSVKEKYLHPPVCNVEAGFYSHPVTITFSQIEPNCEIYFTTDGSDPTNSLTASLYQGSFQIHQTSVIRAVSKPLAGHNALPSPVITNTYFINEQHVLPVVSLCSSHFDDLFQFIKPAIEIEGSFEFFDKNKVRKVKIEGGIKGHGNDSWYYEQKGMRFNVRDEYGDDATINYPFFATSSRTEYDCLILRAGGSDNYVGFAGAAPSTHLRDGFSQTLAEKGGLHLDTRKYEPVVVYINGKYWGIYELREPFDLEYTKAYYGEGKEGVDMLSYYNGLTIDNDASGRARQDWCALYDFIRNNNMAIDENYSFVTAQLDVYSLIDYFCLNTFMVNSDWLNWNTAWWRGKKATNGKWRYRLWDQDNIFNLGQNFSGIPSTDASHAKPCDVQTVSSFANAGCEIGHVDIFNALMQNNHFRNLYFNRYADLLNTVFNKQAMLQHLNAMVADIQPEMPRHCARWEINNTQSYQRWLSNVEKLRNQIRQRVDRAYASMDECYQTKNPVSIIVDVSPAGSGFVSVNTIIPEQFPVSLNYFSGIPVNLSAKAANGYVFSHWKSKKSVLSDNYLSHIIQNFQSPDSIVAVFVKKDNSSTSPAKNLVADYKANIQKDDILLKQLNGVLPDESEPEQLTAYFDKPNYSDSEIEEKEFKQVERKENQEIKIIIPNAFTPNGDGQNDKLQILGEKLNNYKIEVFSANGNLLFKSTDQSEGWDGTFDGEPQPVGSYFCFISGISNNGLFYSTSTLVTLLR